MKKRVLVRWVELHEQEIECDLEKDSPLEKVDIYVSKVTYKSASLEDVEVVGDVERDCMDEAHAEMESC